MELCDHQSDTTDEQGPRRAYHRRRRQPVEDARREDGDGPEPEYRRRERNVPRIDRGQPGKGTPAATLLTKLVERLDIGEPRRAAFGEQRLRCSQQHRHQSLDPVEHQQRVDVPAEGQDADQRNEIGDGRNAAHAMSLPLCRWVDTHISTELWTRGLAAFHTGVDERPTLIASAGRVRRRGSLE